MQHTLKLAAALALVASVTAAQADTVNNPDPYAAGYGFDTPNTATTWGGWTRGDANTLYAEWDTFIDASYAGSRTAAPDAGSANISDAFISWNSGVFATGTGNLYSFSVNENYGLSLTGTVSGSAIQVALQVEVWGVNLSSITLNGLTPTTQTVTYSGTVQASVGESAVYQNLYVWTLDAGTTAYNFNFAAPVHASLTQVAVDIGTVAAVPEASSLALVLAGLGAVGTVVRRRRSR